MNVPKHRWILQRGLACCSWEITHTLQVFIFANSTILLYIPLSNGITSSGNGFKYVILCLLLLSHVVWFVMHKYMWNTNNPHGMKKKQKHINVIISISQLRAIHSFVSFSCPKLTRHWRKCKYEWLFSISDTIFTAVFCQPIRLSNTAVNHRMTWKYYFTRYAAKTISIVWNNRNNTNRRWLFAPTQLYCRIRINPIWDTDKEAMMIISRNTLMTLSAVFTTKRLTHITVLAIEKRRIICHAELIWDHI